MILLVLHSLFDNDTIYLVQDYTVPRNEIGLLLKLIWGFRSYKTYIHQGKAYIFEPEKYLQDIQSDLSPGDICEASERV